MPRKHRKSKTMKGGFLDSLTSWGTSLTQSASNLWNKTKSSLTGTNSYTSSYTSSYTPNVSSTPVSSTPVSSTPVQPMTTSTYGGKTRRRHIRRHISGGFKDNTPQTGLAINAASFSGETAKPHNWVGGKTKRRNNKHKCKKHCRNKH